MKKLVNNFLKFPQVRGVTATPEGELQKRFL